MQQVRNLRKFNQYQEKAMKGKISKKLLKSEDDIEKGRVRNAKDVFKDWKTQYGI